MGRSIKASSQAYKEVEPDFCFYIQNWKAILGKEEIDLAIAPPDLALEVDVTASTKPQDYDEIGCLELWIYKERSLGIYLSDCLTKRLKVPPLRCPSAPE